MIKLIVEPYCEDCDEFEPYIDKNTGKFYNFHPLYGTREVCKTETVITCEHAQRCACIKTYLNQKEKTND